MGQLYFLKLKQIPVLFQVLKTIHYPDDKFLSQTTLRWVFITRERNPLINTVVINKKDQSVKEEGKHF